MGVASARGCVCKEVYRFPHITYPYSSCICSFLQQHPYVLFILKMFFVLVSLYCSDSSRRKILFAKMATWTHFSSLNY